MNPDSVSDIVQGLERIISHREEYVALGEKVRQFSWPLIAEKYVEMYDEIR